MGMKPSLSVGAKVIINVPEPLMVSCELLGTAGVIILNVVVAADGELVATVGGIVRE